MSRLRKTAIPFTWRPLTIQFTEGTAASVNLSVLVENPFRYTLTYSAVGSLPAGVTLVGSLVSYNGVGVETAVTVQFAATSGQYQAVTSPVPLTIVSEAVANTKPTWRVETPATVGTFVRSVGGSFNLSLYSFDAEADPIRYFRSGAAGDTAPANVTINETTGIVTIPVGTTVGAFQLGVLLSDGSLSSDPRLFTLTIANTPPVFTTVPMSPSTLSSIGGSLQFTATDADGDELTYSLTTTRDGITINQTTGLVSVASSAAGTNGNITVQVSDGISTASATVDVRVAAASNVNLIKWNPGVYVSVWGTYSNTVNLNNHHDTPETRTRMEAFLNQYKDDPKIKGVCVRRYVKNWERGTTSPSYDYAYQHNGTNYGGFAMVDWLLSKCAQYGNKRLIVDVEGVGFGNNNPLPQYWVDQGWLFTSGTRRAARLDLQACMTRFLGIWQALATRYNAHPLFEMISQEESTWTVIDMGTGSATAGKIQWMRMLSEGVAMFPNTLVRSKQNYSGNRNNEKEILQHVESLNNAGIGCVTVGGPDHQYSETDSIWPNDLWRGRTTSGVTWKDVRGQLPWVGETQSRGWNLGDPSTFNSATYIYDYHKNTMNASHILVYDQSEVGLTKWNEMYAAIAANNGVAYAATPTCLTGRTVTGGT